MAANVPVTLPCRTNDEKASLTKAGPVVSGPVDRNHCFWVGVAGHRVCGGAPAHRKLPHGRLGTTISVRTAHSRADRSVRKEIWHQDHHQSAWWGLSRCMVKRRIS